MVLLILPSNVSGYSGSRRKRRKLSASRPKPPSFVNSNSRNSSKQKRWKFYSCRSDENVFLVRFLKPFKLSHWLTFSATGRGKELHHLGELGPAYRRSSG